MLKKIWNWIRFGKVTSKVHAIDGGVASEIEYFDRFGRSVGYWAYGHFGPAGKYKG